MSLLRVGRDDHPEAALKHMDDGKALQDAGRPDGAAYHAGYVVECSLKSIILHERSFDSATGVRDTNRLTMWHKKLSCRPYGHDLEQILNITVGPEGARYMPPLHDDASVVREWSETMRYWAPTVSVPKAKAFLEWAELTVQAVVKMKLDGVV
jgi:hypothetical protein